MSREKKSKVDDLAKLRRILDNSSDLALDSFLTKDEKALESILRRLRGNTSTTQLTSNRFLAQSTSMEPKVFIHERIPSAHHSTPLHPKIEQQVSLPKFELVSTIASSKQELPREISFDTEDLFEIEKVDSIVPEFIEITPKQPLQPLEETQSTMQSDETPVQDSSLPEWQSVTDETEKNIQEPYNQQKADSTPEFEQVTISQAPETLEKEETKETSIDFLPIESSEPLHQMLTRQQIRGLKRTQRKKEKEAKKLQRIEQKRLRKERRQRAKEEKQAMKKHPLLLQSQKEEPVTVETFEPIEPAQKKVYGDEFKGIECIDEKTAELLYKNGYFSVENLKDATLDDLVQIRGIKRKLAKQIKKEIGPKITPPDTDEFIPMRQTPTKKKSAKKLKDTAEWESYSAEKETLKHTSPKICSYKGYILYKRVSSSNDRKKTTIHFFSKGKPMNSQPTQLPKGYRIAVNKKTGVPYLKKKR